MGVKFLGRVQGEVPAAIDFGPFLNLTERACILLNVHLEIIDIYDCHNVQNRHITSYIFLGGGGLLGQRHKFRV